MPDDGHTFSLFTEVCCELRYLGLVGKGNCHENIYLLQSNHLD